MTIYEIDNTLRSDLTPEWAHRDSDGWHSTWFPDRVLSRRQAWAAMRLDEIVSHPLLVDDRRARALAAEYADELGILLDQAIIRLFKRMVVRMHDAGSSVGTALIR